MQDQLGPEIADRSRDASLESPSESAAPFAASIIKRYGIFHEGKSASMRGEGRPKGMEQRYTIGCNGLANRGLSSCSLQAGMVLTAVHAVLQVEVASSITLITIPVRGSCA